MGATEEVTLYVNMVFNFSGGEAEVQTQTVSLPRDKKVSLERVEVAATISPSAIMLEHLHLGLVEQLTQPVPLSSFVEHSGQLLSGERPAGTTITAQLRNHGSGGQVQLSFYYNKCLP